MNFHTQILMGHRGYVGANEPPIPPPGNNPPVSVVPSAWNFDTTPCTYTMQPNDTIDGIAQTYMGAPPGNWVPPGSPTYPQAINKIDLLNLDNPDIASGHQEKLQVGTILKMPPEACNGAKIKIKASCTPKQIFDGKRCLNCPPNSSPNTVTVTIAGTTYEPKSVCLCDDGFIPDGKGGCAPAPPPPPTPCGPGTHWDGSQCVPDQVVPPVTPPAPAKAKTSYAWPLAAAAGVGLLFLVGPRFTEKKRKRKR